MISSAMNTIFFATKISRNTLNIHNVKRNESQCGMHLASPERSVFGKIRVKELEL